MKSLIALYVFLLVAAATAETNVTSSLETESAPPAKKERPWIIAPMVVANPAFGNGGGAVGMYFFNTQKKKGDNPDSSLTAMGLYSDTDSYFVGVFGQTFWKDDTWRVNAGIGHPKINNDFSYDVPSIGTANVEFSTTIVGLMARADRRLGNNFFLGLKGVIVDEAYSDANDAALIYFDLAEVEDATSGQLGVIGSYDSRDHVRYPTSGNQTELSWTAVPEAWGAPSSYYVTEGFVNQFYSFVDRQVLALRVYGRFTPDDTPYSGLSTLGRFGDLRGYTAGKLVAENIIAAQAEYRAMFTKKIGAVAFFGVSELYNGHLKNTNSDNFYPSGGIGFRYMMNQENKMNFRFDYAWGSNAERGFYVSVGEAF